MVDHTGIFVNYGRGTKQQYSRKGIIWLSDPQLSSSGKVIGWWVGWPEKDPKLFGRIVGTHGSNGYLMAQFKHGLPGYALGTKVTIMEVRPGVTTRPHASTPKALESGSKIVE